jgi:phage anti-repressor protein
MNINEVKIAIRDFFIENYNILCQGMDLYESVDISERYQELLRHYIKLVETDSCYCFNSVADLISAMESNKSQDYKYIKHGI